MGTGLRVLFVEDHQDVAFGLSRQLRKLAGDIAIEIATTLKEAIRRLKLPPAPDGGPYDVVLLDLNLPDSVGLSTLRAITAATDIPTVVYTGLPAGAADETAKKAIELGAAAWLDKIEAAPETILRTLRLENVRGGIMQIRRAMLRERTG